MSALAVAPGSASSSAPHDELRIGSRRHRATKSVVVKPRKTHRAIDDLFLALRKLRKCDFLVSAAKVPKHVWQQRSFVIRHDPNLINRVPSDCCRSTAIHTIQGVLCSPYTPRVLRWSRRLASKELGKRAEHFLPNVKDQPRVCLARAVRKHGS